MTEPPRRVWVDGFGYLDVEHLRKNLARAGWSIVPSISDPEVEHQRLLHRLLGERVSAAEATEAAETFEALERETRRLVEQERNGG